jgi:lipoprotein LprA
MCAVRSVVAIGLLVAVLAAGCGGDDEAGEPTAEELVAQAGTAFADAGSFHLVYDFANPPSGGSGLRLTHAKGDVAVSDGAQQGINVEVAGTFSGIPLESQLVIVGDDAYLKDPLIGTWRELDIDQVPGAFSDLVKGVPEILADIQDLERAGEERVDGVDTYQIRGTVTAAQLSTFLGNAPSAKRVPVELWIGKEDSLIRRIEVDGPVEENDPDDAKRTVDLSDFGKSVTIERPAP